LTKVKVIQLGFLIAFVGFLSYKYSNLIGLNELSYTSISNLILFGIVFTWVLSYLLRVINGNMTFMEQRKRYRKKYEKIISEKLQKKFNSLTNEEQNKLLKEINEK
tara:strand:- start:1312 stop:1629 length:318 start_codon:yes stop_codon:yes gene_type:complete